MFMFFFLYPALALTTMSVFDCDPNVGRLRNDFRVVCPTFTSFAGLYSLAFCLIYPIGIPTAMHVVLRLVGIVQVVKERVENAEFHAMQALFIKLTVPSEMKLVAGLIGNVDDDRQEFFAQTQKEFDKLLALQGGGGDELDLETLTNVANDVDEDATGMAGYLHIICKCLQLFDINGDGKMIYSQFYRMMRDARAKANLFTGVEELRELDDKQMQEILVFRAWPTKHAGPGGISISRISLSNSCAYKNSHALSYTHAHEQILITTKV